MIKRLLGAALLMAAVLILGGCVNLGLRSIAGHIPSGELASRSFSPGRFEGIDIGGQWDVVFRRGDSHFVEIKMQESLFDILSLNVRGDDLMIGFDGNITGGIEPRPVAIIYAPFLNSVTLRGQASAKDWDDLNPENFSIRLSGQSDISLNMEVHGRLSIDVSGQSRADLVGAAERADINASGQSSVNAMDLRTADVEIDVSGQSVVEIYAIHEADVSASGMSSVRLGGGARLQQRTSGTASVIRVD